MEDSNLSQLVEDWVKNSVGYFNIKDIYYDLRIETRSAKNLTSQKLKRMAENKVIQRKSGVHGIFRRIVTDAEVIDWRNADYNNTIPLILLFNINKYINIYPKNIIILAGASNAGKTAFILNFIHDNQNLLPEKLNLFSSETGAEELKMRIMSSGLPLSEWNFNAYSRSANFADVINPNAINVIDYLEVTSNFAEVGTPIREIHDSLDKGIALIVLQKKSNTKDFKYDLAKGAEATMEKARLYLSIDNGVCKIIKGKNWADPNINPNGMEFRFKLVNGYKFINLNPPKQMQIPDDMMVT